MDKEKKIRKKLKRLTRKRRRFVFPLVTVILLILLAASLYGLYLVVKEFKNTPPMTQTVGGRSVIGSKSTGGKVTDKTEYGDYHDLSAELAKLISTHTEWTNIDKNPEEKGFSCIATEDEGARMVYNIDPMHVCGDHTLKDFNYIWVDSVNSAFCCLINISGEEVDLSDYYVLVHDSTGNLASRLVINCYEAKVVKLNRAIISGTILAPDANVEYESTVIYGAVYAKASTGARGYFKHIAFGYYDEIIKESKKYEFTNIVIRSKVYGFLKKNYPDQYGTYPDDYVMNYDDLAKITSLDLEGEYIADTYDDLKGLVNLEYLSLKNTKLKSLDLSAQTKLRYLDISGTDISEIILPDSVTITDFIAEDSGLMMLDTKSLKNAKYVILNNNPFYRDFPDFRNLEKVEVLLVSSTGMDDYVARQFYGLKNLKQLDASGNDYITEFDFSQLPSLEYADFKRCGLKSVNFEGAVSLNTVNLSYNEMKEIDASAAPALVTLEAYGDYKSVTVKDDTVNVSCLEKTKVIFKENQEG